MNRPVVLAILISATCAAVPRDARAALPTLSGLADAIAEITSGISEMRERWGGVTNWQTRADSRMSDMRDRIAALVETRNAMLVVIEGDKNLRERYHGGRLGQYVLTNDVGRLIRVDLYGDGTSWTNGASQAVNRLVDPEAAAKAAAEAAATHERIQAAWERANLPPGLAELRARQREAARSDD